MKQLISISFILLFMATITLPSVVVLIDDSVDISLLLDASEEEEEKGNEKNKELEVLQLTEENINITHSSPYSINYSDYQFKTYITPNINLVFPPPDYI